MDQTEPRSIHSPDTMNQIRIVKYPARFQGGFSSGIILSYQLAILTYLKITKEHIAISTPQQTPNSFLVLQPQGIFKTNKGFICEAGCFPLNTLKAQGIGGRICVARSLFPNHMFQQLEMLQRFLLDITVSWFHSPLLIFEEQYKVQTGDKYRASGGNREEVG